jgi:hypothetical protein
MSLVLVAFFGSRAKQDAAPRNDDLTSGGRNFRIADPVEDQEL